MAADFMRIHASAFQWCSQYVKRRITHVSSTNIASINQSPINDLFYFPTATLSDSGTINISYYLIRIPVRASTIYSHSGARSYRTETRQLRQRLHGICDNVVVHRRLHFIIIACCCRCMLPVYVCMYFILNKYMYIFECMCAYYIYVVMNASVLSMMFASSFILSFFIVYVLIVVGRKALRELLACIPYVTPRACISLCLCECDHIHQ